MRVDNNEYEMTHKEIAEAMGVSRGLVNHIEKKAFKKIEALLSERGIDVKELLEKD